MGIIMFMFGAAFCFTLAAAFAFSKDTLYVAIGAAIVIAAVVCFSFHLFAYFIAGFAVMALAMYVLADMA